MLKSKPHIIEKWPEGSKFILCVDESGDRDLNSINPNWPILSICGILLDLEAFDKIRHILLRLKQHLWPPEGQDEDGRSVCFHSRDMRRKAGAFSERALDTTKRALMDETIWEGIFGNKDIRMRIYAALIDKRRLTSQYTWPDDPYNLAVTFILERIVFNAKGTTILFEARGKNEDKLLYDHVLDLFTYGSAYVHPDSFEKAICDVGFHPKFNDQGRVVCGLELADLAAYTLGSWCLRGVQTRYSSILIPRLAGYSPISPMSAFGRGLKVFPDLDTNQRRTLMGVRP